jgi:hypothetical protein
MTTVSRRRPRAIGQVPFIGLLLLALLGCVSRPADPDADFVTVAS